VKSARLLSRRTQYTHAMGLMDRDYWREKHTAKPRVRPDLSHLQSSLDAQTARRHLRPAPSNSPRLAAWLKQLALFVAICVAVFAALWVSVD
jgi:ferric-dicitrate binding protein FerR (iron transport regulator)